MNYSDGVRSTRSTVHGRSNLSSRAKRSRSRMRLVLPLFRDAPYTINYPQESLKNQDVRSSRSVSPRMVTRWRLKCGWPHAWLGIAAGLCHSCSSGREGQGVYLRVSGRRTTSARNLGPEAGCAGGDSRRIQADFLQLAWSASWRVDAANGRACPQSLRPPSCINQR